MKAASPATLAILAAGQYFKAELYSFVLSNGVTYNFTTSQVPLTVSGVTYQTGLVIVRQQLTQKVGLEVQSLELDISMQLDNPSGPVQIAGVSFLQAAAARVFDAARVTMYKIFLSNWNDTSPGAVKWFQGRVNLVVVGRQTAIITINADTEMLNVAMPGNILQPGCLHEVFDAGCTLQAMNFNWFGNVTANPLTGGNTTLQFNTTLTQVSGYFNLGIITFNSGANAGLSFSVSTYLSANGSIRPIRPLPSAPVVGDAFRIRPNCLKTMVACANTNPALGPPYNNLVHWRGYKFIPNPETLYDGGTAPGAAANPIGGQGGGGRS
jgi:uncharacterized phage protein (TIGR02218 family)